VVEREPGAAADVRVLHARGGEARLRRLGGLDRHDRGVGRLEPEPGLEAVGERDVVGADRVDADR
jgi:hypothetical protein